MSAKRPHPIAVCTKCGNFLLDVGAVPRRCPLPLEGRRCDGIYARADRDDAWAECKACHATGLVDGVGCRPCEGYGWLYNLQRSWRQFYPD